MKKIVCMIFLLLQIGNAYTAETQTIARPVVTFPGVEEKIKDELYAGKVADDFYLAMEHVNADNRDIWRKYAESQLKEYMDRNPTIEYKQKYLPIAHGITSFKGVLDDEKLLRNNELWVAYASAQPVLHKARPGSDIEMFVTVITSPDALITSHMGISRSVQAAKDLAAQPPKRRKKADQSIHLHSFAAKVMKMRNPNRVFMLTAPLDAMRDIFIKKMPQHTVFVGDNRYQEDVEALEEDDLEEGGQEFVDLLTTHPPRIVTKVSRKKRKSEESEPEEIPVSFTIQNPDGSTLVSFDKSTGTYSWMFNELYYDSGLETPYVLTDLNALAKATPLFDEKAVKEQKQREE